MILLSNKVQEYNAVFVFFFQTRGTSTIHYVAVPSITMLTVNENLPDKTSGMLITNFLITASIRSHF